jgi:23S rRNA pseudouridine2605 synthase
MSDDNNQKSRGPRKGGGAGSRGGGRDGDGFGGKGPRPSGSTGGERKPFRSRSDSAERPARADGPARPFRARPDGERSPSRPPREGGERPFRTRPEGERNSSRPPREGFAPRGERSGGAGPGAKRFDRPRSDRPRRPREEAPVSQAKLLPSLVQEPERIAKVMARAGVASRRDSEAMILEGRVSVNGKVLESPALDVGPDDVVLIDGELLPARERTRMWLYHKPRGLVTTNHDPEGRPTVFDALPEDLPRVLSIGRLDINTEGLLLLTNDGGLARMLELPETGWLRRYRVRAFGSVTQDKLDTLRDGVTIEGISYGPVVARFERQQGSNTWLTVDLREGKNREVKTVLEHLGLDVNRLIRVSFGPFQLGDLPEGEADEIRSRVLKDQLGEELMAKAGVDFEAPRRDELPAAPPRPQPSKAAPSGDDRPRRRESGDRDGKPERERWQSDAVRTPSLDDRSDKPWKRTVWRDEEAQPQRERKAPPRRGADPKAERQTREATGEVVRRRDKAIADPNGRRVLVERVSATPREERASREERPAREGVNPKRRPDRLPRSERGAAQARPPRTQERSNSGERPARRPRIEGGERDRTQERPWQDAAPRSERPERAPRGDRPERAPREGGERPPRRFSERPGEERGGDRRPGGRNFGDKPGGSAGKSYAARSSERPAGRSGTGERSGGKSFGGKPGGGKPSGGRPFGGKPGGGGRPGGDRPGGGKGPRPGGKRG